ncbi:MAG TPA: adenylate/guanylate cyclase domain-containing protein, partial [Acidimicrobiales bacterium]|nr:adenylate/guanylate cyclase domain-containing protein [Acidimicrobiales bacterium]
MRCPACGGQAPDGARFCPTCGQALHGRGDERRVVTVLFADLVGFTGMSEARDPEQVKNLVDRCFQRLASDVTSYGGRVDNIVGDAIVALFGAPVAHEDDAERAVRAALQMQETVAGMGNELLADVRLRVGVNTGVVLVGAVRGGGEYTAMGDVVNVASRLQGMAAPGQVVVGPLTHAATETVVDFEPLGPVRARGREEPVEAWIALGCLSRPGSRPHRAETPLVGREAELGMLHHALATAAARKRAQLILLLGEAGMGKSRLAEELACRARAEHGALVLEGRCVPYGEANVWWPVAEAIREAAGIDEGDPAEVLADKCRSAVASAAGMDAGSPEAGRLADGLLYLMGDEAALADVDPQRARDEARRSLQAFLEGLARRQPVVVVLSELHWAHEWVLEGIDRLLERLRHLPVVIVCTARPELEARWAYQPSHRNLVLLHVDPLDELEAAQLLTSLLGREPPAEARELLLERSGGNPLFLEELVGLLGEQAVLAGWDGDRGGGAHSDELPATLRGLVAARLDALDAGEREAVEDAAVVGRTASLDALVALVKARGEPNVAGVLDQLAAKDLLSFDPAGQWEFRSALVRDVAYETLTMAERARRHARLADWIGGRVKETGREDEVLEQLAHHYGAAAELVSQVGQVEGVRDDIAQLALGAVYKAAHRARERDLYRVAIHLYDLAVRLLEPGASVARRRLLLERASAYAATRELSAARVDVDEVLKEAAQVADLHSEAKALNELGRIQQAEADYEASAASLDRALEL